MSSIALHEPAIEDLDKPTPPPQYCGCAVCRRPAVSTCDAVVGDGVCGRLVCDAHRKVCASVVKVVNGRSAIDTLDLCPTHQAGGG